MRPLMTSVMTSNPSSNAQDKYSELFVVTQNGFCKPKIGSCVLGLAPFSLRGTFSLTCLQGEKRRHGDHIMSTMQTERRHKRNKIWKSVKRVLYITKKKKCKLN